MIAGLLLRNFKIFRNQHYIPIMLENSSSYFIGENGVGKSSVLLALDNVLNGTDINKLDINNEARSQGFETREPFIVPIFIIEKDKIKRNPVMNRILEVISSITWDVKPEDFNSLQKSLAEKFTEHRKKLSKYHNKRTHYLIPIGFIKEKATDIPIASMSIFESIEKYNEKIEELFTAELIPWLKKYNFDDVKTRMLAYIKDYYNYIYIPAEITVNSYSKIEGELAQSLLGDDIQSKIEKIIKKSDIDKINQYLNKYIESISELLDNSYRFKKPSQRQTQFTQRHMIIKIIETYFNDKILHRKKEGRDTPINNLSSGEKRRALLDLATAFLKANPSKAINQTIFAIDEPELSLHSTACFEQFEKIKKISELDIQTLVTTHWYGFLPAAGLGTAIYISPNQSLVKSLNLSYYRDEITSLVKDSKGSYLDTLEVKSNHDLVQSIIASITTKNNYNWLLCEGRTDKKYLEYHMDAIGIKNLTVLSVGGSFALKDIYSYLVMALKDRKKTIKGKVFCLLDTDRAYDKFKSSDEIPNLLIRRILLTEDRSRVEVLKTTDNRVSPPTEIEDALEGVFFHEAMMSLKIKGDSRFDFLDNIELLDSEVSGGILDLTTKQSRIIQGYFNENGNKELFCDEYCEILLDCDEARTPNWLLQIAHFFCPDIYDRLL